MGRREMIERLMETFDGLNEAERRELFRDALAKLGDMGLVVLGGPLFDE